MGYTKMGNGVDTTLKMEERIASNNRVGETKEGKMEDDETVALLGPAPDARRGEKESGNAAGSFCSSSLFSRLLSSVLLQSLPQPSPLSTQTRRWATRRTAHHLPTIAHLV